MNAGWEFDEPIMFGWAVGRAHMRQPYQLLLAAITITRKNDGSSCNIQPISPAEDYGLWPWRKSYRCLTPGLKSTVPLESLSLIQSCCKDYHLLNKSFFGRVPTVVRNLLKSWISVHGKLLFRSMGLSSLIWVPFSPTMVTPACR